MSHADQSGRAASTLDSALHSFRHPATALGAVLAATATRLGAGLVAAYAVQPERRSLQLLGAAGSHLTRPGVAETLEATAPEEMEGLHAGHDVAVVDRPPTTPDPWRRFASVTRADAWLPGGASLRVVAGADQPLDEDALRAEVGPIAALAAIVHTAREVELLREELHRLRQDRTLMAASLQHDLRTPLTSIMGSARTLERRSDRLEPEDRQELLRIIAVQAERLSGMVSEAFTREIGSPDAPLRMRRADLEPLAQRVAAAARAARGGSVTVQVEPAVILTDPDRLERALLNLLDNALKYSPRDRPVHLVGEAARDRHTFTVADSGPGVAADILPSLFGAFATDRSRPGGTGLGLHSVVRLAAELGGNVSYSRRGGVTRFCLVVPDLDRGPSPEAGVAATGRGSVAGGHPR